MLLRIFIAMLLLPAWVRAEDYVLGFDTRTDPTLQDQLTKADAAAREKLDMKPEQTMVGLLDLSTTPPRLALINPDKETYAASVPKIGILLAYFQQKPEAAAKLDPAVRKELGE